jgi:hypothetical protein
MVDVIIHHDDKFPKVVETGQKRVETYKYRMKEHTIGETKSNKNSTNKNLNEEKDNKNKNKNDYNKDENTKEVKEKKRKDKTFASTKEALHRICEESIQQYKATNIPCLWCGRGTHYTTKYNVMIAEGV